MASKRARGRRLQQRALAATAIHQSRQANVQPVSGPEKVVLPARQFRPHWQPPHRPEDRLLLIGGQITEAYRAMTYGCTGGRHGVRCACLWCRIRVPIPYSFVGMEGSLD